MFALLREGRLIDRVADRVILLAIGSVLVKRVLADAKPRRPEAELTERT